MGTAKAEPEPSLSAKQRTFVEAYLRTKNASEAARQAGYKHPGVEGHRLLRNAKIIPHIAAAQVEATERTKIDLDYVLRRLAVEAEREDERSSHSARVAALGQLRQHFESPAQGDGNAAPALNINISSAAPVSDVRVTRPDS